MQSNASRTIIALLILLIVAAGAYAFMNGRDTRTDGQRIGDAIDGVGSKGISEGVNRLGDQTPAQRVGNAIEDNK